MALGGVVGIVLLPQKRIVGRSRAQPALLMIDQQGGPGQWAVRQIFDDPAGHRDWGISAVVDLDASDEAGSAVLCITDVGQLSGF